MVDLGMHKFKYLNTGKITPEESFMNAYTEDNYELEQFHHANKRLRVISYAKYERENLHKVMLNQCQHLTITQHNEFLKLSQKFEEFFDGTLGTYKIDPEEFKRKENDMPIC